MPTPAFVICWSESEPNRVGQIARLVSGDHRIGDDDAHTDTAALTFAAERPGDAGEGRPLQPGCASTQLSIHAGMFGVRIRAADGSVAVNGSNIPGGQWLELAPGDTVHVRHDLLVLFTLVPTHDPLVQFPPHAIGGFGEPDALGIVGESDAVWRWREAIAAVAATGEHVLIHGECGTGKELTAGGIHALSTRSGGRLWRGHMREDWEVPFFFYGHAQNFRGFPEEEREGLLGCVDGGTLFVDHVQHAYPQGALEALHAVLERSGQYQRVGDPRPRTSTFVVLAATNENPEDIPPLLRKHLRRRIATPALADHREDIPLLIRMELRERRRMAEWDGDPSSWTEYARVLAEPNVIERLLRADYRDSGVFGLRRHMSEEERSVGPGLARSLGR